MSHDGFGKVYGRDENLAAFLESVRSPFSEIVTVPLTNVFSLKSAYGLSALRDVQTTAGSASITHTGDEFKLANTANGTDSAELRSAQTGRYEAGYGAEAGIGVRLSAEPTGSQDAQWGLFNDSDGFMFGRDATGLYIGVMRDGSLTKVRQDDWNGDKMNGRDESGLTLDPTAGGNVYQVGFSYYGFGAVVFRVVQEDDETKRQRVITLHRYVDRTRTSVQNPNLPINAKVANGGTATALSMFVTGRKYAIQGTYDPERRITGETVVDVSVATGSAFTPLATMRRKANVTDGAFFESVSVKMDDVQMISDEDLEVILLLNGGLTGDNFVDFSNVSASETALEVDTSASAISGGEYLDGGIVAGGQGNQRAFTDVDPLDFDFIQRQPVTLAARSLGAGAATVTAIMKVREEW